MKWYESSIRKILSNEKYKAEALLQKTYTVDFLSKKHVVNDSDVPQYYIENSHPAIIDKDTWEAVQLETVRRKVFMKHRIKTLDYVSDELAFTGKVICGKYGHVYGRKVWNSTNEGLKRKIWQCNNKYIAKGVINCENDHIDEKVLRRVFTQAIQSYRKQGILFKEMAVQKYLI